MSVETLSRNYGTEHLRRLRSRFQLYLKLSKSGIVALVLISTFGGFFAGQPLETPVSISSLLLTLFGMLLLASGSSALNQIQESSIDAKMPRTHKRPLPSGDLSLQDALTFVGISIPGGVLLLALVDLQISLLGLLAVFLYNVLYTLWWKPRWPYAAIPGAIPGALPILMGFVAANGNLWAPGGIYLFLLMVYWQMPHFWVLAIRYKDDYAKGGIPTLPVSRGTELTVKQITIWTLGYVALAMIAPLFLPVGWIYLAVALVTGGKLLLEARRYHQSRQWLKFFLWVNFSLMIYIGAVVLDLWSGYLQIPFI